MTQEQLERGYELQDEIQGSEHELEKLRTYFRDPINELFLYTQKGVSHYVTVPKDKHGIVYQLMYDTYMQVLLKAQAELAAL